MEADPLTFPERKTFCAHGYPGPRGISLMRFNLVIEKPKACDPQHSPRPEIILQEHCVCLQMVLDCFSWMPYFPKARSRFRESLKFEKVLCSKSKVLSPQGSAALVTIPSLERAVLGPPSTWGLLTTHEGRLQCLAFSPVPLPF